MHVSFWKGVYVNPNHPIYPSPPFLPGNCKIVFYICECFCFVSKNCFISILSKIRAVYSLLYPRICFSILKFNETRMH